MRRLRGETLRRHGQDGGSARSGPTPSSFQSSEICIGSSTMTRKAYVLVACLILAVGQSLRADDSTAKEVLERARKVAQSIEGISFDATFLGDGALGKSLPVMDGKVIAVKSSSPKYPRLRIDGSKTLPRGIDSMPFRFVSNGVTSAFADDYRRVYMSGKAPDALPQERLRLLPAYYLTPDAFENELRAKQVELGKPRVVCGVKCIVLEVKYDDRGMQQATICIGAEDYLVRSVVLPRPAPARMRTAAGPDSAEIFMACNLAVNPKIEETTFSLPMPKGYRAQPFISPTPRTASGLLEAGSKAPDWKLPDAEGNEVSLSSLRGKVVVIDFWASWCGPCKMALPYLQQLHDKYKDKPVKVFSINCRERMGDAAARKYFKDHDLTYPQLFNGDSAANAYLVRGIPTMYVIGTDGKILHSERGFKSNLVPVMSQIIDKHLEKSASAGAGKSEKTAKAG